MSSFFFLPLPSLLFRAFSFGVLYYSRVGRLRTAGGGVFVKSYAGVTELSLLTNFFFQAFYGLVFFSFNGTSVKCSGSPEGKEPAGGARASFRVLIRSADAGGSLFLIAYVCVLRSSFLRGWRAVFLEDKPHNL